MAEQDPKMVQCTDAELAAFVQEQRAAAVVDFVNDSGARVRSSTGYYSTCRFQLLCSALVGTTYTLTMSRRTRQPFAYSLGEKGSVAGFVEPTGTELNMTETQTNLSDAKNTRSGERFIIKGISAIVTPGSDMFLAKWIWQHANVKIVKNDVVGDPLGPLSFFPALSSMNGDGDSYNRRPAPQSNNYVAHSFRGSEGIGGYFDLKASPIIWMPTGKKDSSLYLAVDLDEDFVAPEDIRAATPPTVDAWQPQASFNTAPIGPQPAPGKLPVFGSYVDIVFRFMGSAESVMSVNQ